MAEPAKARPKACRSCPYRRDVPSGVWDDSEYVKLLRYDGETFDQSPALFFCHQQDGHLCSGWLACHDPGELLAVRLGVMSGKVDYEVYDYATDVEVFSSGAEAAEHGMAEIAEPSERARQVVDKIIRRRQTRTT